MEKRVVNYTIRIAPNDRLERDIAEMMSRISSLVSPKSMVC
jgi:hypothetical protein